MTILQTTVVVGLEFYVDVVATLDFVLKRELGFEEELHCDVLTVCMYPDVFYGVLGNVGVVEGDSFVAPSFLHSFAHR